uniref:Uncharacterized protein n=1 Tax=Rhabditophanes sp. KR3021 TaxID=114890 RepID=A0AC35U3H0_9BILA
MKKTPGDSILKSSNNTTNPVADKEVFHNAARRRVSFSASREVQSYSVTDTHFHMERIVERASLGSSFSDSNTQDSICSGKDPNDTMDIIGGNLMNTTDKTMDFTLDGTLCIGNDTMDVISYGIRPTIRTPSTPAKLGEAKNLFSKMMNSPAYNGTPRTIIPGSLRRRSLGKPLGKITFIEPIVEEEQPPSPNQTLLIDENVLNEEYLNAEKYVEQLSKFQDDINKRDAKLAAAKEERLRQVDMDMNEGGILCDTTSTPSEDFSFTFNLNESQGNTLSHDASFKSNKDNSVVDNDVEMVSFEESLIQNDICSWLTPLTSENGSDFEFDQNYDRKCPDYQLALLTGLMRCVLFDEGEKHEVSKKIVSGFNSHVFLNDYLSKSNNKYQLHDLESELSSSNVSKAIKIVLGFNFDIYGSKLERAEAWADLFDLYGGVVDHIFSKAKKFYKKTVAPLTQESEQMCLRLQELLIKEQQKKMEIVEIFNQKYVPN